MRSREHGNTDVQMMDLRLLIVVHRAVGSNRERGRAKSMDASSRHSSETRIESYGVRKGQKVPSGKHSPTRGQA